MRYVEGADLRERLRRGRLEPGEAIAILAQVASALDAAHARGLVHRDVKPSNVLLDTGASPDGSDHAYLADFGLTKRLTEKSGLGDDGQLMGTIDYVAPEQIAGEELDGRADVYSLGCVLYECLVGEPPFPRDTDVAAVFAHLDAEPPAVSDHRPELPAELDEVIARALAKAPEQRYSSCRELARAALAVTVDEASRLLAEAASRAASGRSDLSEAEAELAGKVIGLQLAREQARALSATPTPSRLAAQGVCPFKGLASFEPADADYFFGRERLIAELVARLVGASFLGIVGPSGSGKSSVLRAGLLPALAGGVLPGSERWRRVLIRPGERPLDELRRMLASGAKDPVAEALDALTADERILLAVDQLEELFTACKDETQRAAFVDMLARAAADPQGRAVVTVAVRADFYGRFAAFPRLAELLGANHVLVGPMQASELRRAIELPASRVGLRVEPELADTLVDDVEGEPGALPLLSTALLELWQKRQDNTLTAAVYRESGGVHGAVARLAEGTYARIPDGDKPLVRPIMLRLVGEGEGEAAVRRRAPLTELDLERNREVESVLAALADSRLVTVSEGSVEVAHEALLREWPRLREWIEEDGQGRRLRRHITQAATEWDVGRDQGELYRGARLAAALDWSTDHALELNELERAFVAESREASEKETKRVRRPTGVSADCSSASRSCWPPPSQAGSSPSSSAARRATRRATPRPPSSPSASARRRSSRRTSTARCCSRARPWRSTIRRRREARSSPASYARRPRSGSSTPARVTTSGQSPSARMGGRSLWEGSAPRGCASSTRQRTSSLVSPSRTGRPRGLTPTSRDWRTAPTAAHSLSATRGRGISVSSTRSRASCSPRRALLAARMAFTADGSKLVAVELEDGRPITLAIRNASHARADRRPDRARGLLGRATSARSPPRPSLRSPPTAAPSSPHRTTASSPGGTCEPVSRRGDIEIETGHHALALSPDGRTAAVGVERGLQLVDCPADEVREPLPVTGVLATAPRGSPSAPTATRSCRPPSTGS